METPRSSTEAEDARSANMITADKQRGALRALNAVLVLARALAYDGLSADVAEVLDVAEYLPLLMLAREDRTREFRDNLEGLATKWPAFGLALERFDATTAAD
jgi:hypothetical protein